MNKFNLVVIVVFGLILGGFIWLKDGLSPADEGLPSESDVFQSQALINIAGYVDYSSESLVAAQTKGATVLFFAATTWCNTCSALDDEIIARYREIPADVTILRIDYDNDQTTRDMYHVTVQHTIIVLDQDGDEVKRWVGGGFDALMQQLAEI